MSTGAKILSKAQQAFARIGHQNSHVMPDLTAPSGLSNQDADLWHNKQAAAHELMIAGTLSSIASKRLKTAKASCGGQGLLEHLSDVVVGTSATLFSGELVAITAQVNNPTSRVDMVKLRNELTKSHGMTTAKVDSLMKKCTVKNKPAVIITASPKLAD